MAQFGRSFPAHPATGRSVALLQTAGPRIAEDQAAAVDAAFRALSTSRTAADTAGAIDVPRAAQGRTAADTAAASDLATRLARFGRAVADVAAATDTTSRVATFRRTAADTAPAVVAQLHWSQNRLVSDTAQAVDVAGRLPMHKTRTVPELAPAHDGEATPTVVYPGGVATNANPFWPVTLFEAEFTSGPPSLGVSYRRRSLSAKSRRHAVQKWSTARGRQYELDQAQAGTATLDIPDPLDYLNPDNPGSPFNTGGRSLTSYRSFRIASIWPNQPGSGNLLNQQISGIDPGFEGGSGGLTIFQGVPGKSLTVANTTTAAHPGTGTTSKVLTFGPGAQGEQFAAPLAPGLTYTMSTWVYPTGGATLQLALLDGGGTYHYSQVATQQNTWQRLWVSWTAVEAAEPLFLIPPAGGGTVYIDDQQLEFGANLTPYTNTGPTFYPIFSGYIERYPTTYDMDGYRARRPLVAVDALALLAEAPISQSYDAEIGTDNPLVYLPLSGKKTPATGADLGTGLGGGAYPNFIISQNGSVNWGGDQQPDGTAAVVFSSQNPNDPPTQFPAGSFTEMAVQGGSVSLNPVQGFTWECWVRYVSGTAQIGTLELIKPGDPRGLNNFVPLIGAANFNEGVIASFYNPTGNSSDAVLADNLPSVYPDGEWHYMVITVHGGLLGSAVDGGTMSYAAVTAAPGSMGLNTFYMESSSQYATPQSQVSSGRFAVYPSILSVARIAAHYQRGVGYVGEYSGARVTRLLAAYWGGATSVDVGAIPLAEDFSYDTRSTSDGSQGQQRAVLDALQEIQDTERGLLYVAANGTVTFEARYRRAYQPTPYAVLGENPAGASPVEYPYADYATDHDPTYVFSAAALTRTDNTDIPTMVNSATQATYGQRILTQTLLSTNDFDVLQAGIFYLQRYSNPVTRITKLTLKPSANPAMWPMVLGLEISKRVTVNRRSQSGFMTSNDYYVEQINHTVDSENGEWTVDLQLSPVFVDSAWLCGDSTYGVLGTNTTVIY